MTEQLEPMPYYMTHFFHVLDAVVKHYGNLLSPEETLHIEKLHMLPLPAVCLYARLANRKGPYFRLAKLEYIESQPVEHYFDMLAGAGLLMECAPNDLPFPLQSLWQCFTFLELKPLCGKALQKKAALCELLEQQDDCANILAQLLTDHRVICLHPDDPWEFLKFLFFGELTENLSDFVVQELGHIVTEKQTEAELKPQFSSRKDATACYWIARYYQDFRILRDKESAIELYAWWRELAIRRDALPLAAYALYDRLVERLGKILEREKYYAIAIELYIANPIAPCRERHVRLLMKENRKAEALQLCQRMLATPCDTEELYSAQQLMNRLEKKHRSSAARRLLSSSSQITVDYDSLNVEASVLNYHYSQGWNGVHSENWLWNALFGLLLWDIIYDASYGTFHHPLQMAPTDLYQPRFYNNRADAIEKRLLLLNDTRRCVAFLKSMHTEKAGIANPFMGWHAETPTLLEKLLQHVPPCALIATLRHMAKDVKRHRIGFPDLFIWRDDSYRLLEVKSQNDQLSAQQYNLLQFFAQHGVNVQALKVHVAQPVAA